MESPHLLSAMSKQYASKQNGWPPPENFKPVIVGGHDLTSMRAQFDQDSKNIIVASNRQLFYYNVETSLQAGKANLISSNLSANDKIAACERLDSSLYVITNHGLIFIWSLETRDWINELSLPLNEGETLISCKMLSKRQYIYSILDPETKKTTLFFSMSRSERERPKQREAIGECTLGEQQTFDIGAFFDMTDLAEESKTKRDKLAKQHCLTYIQGPYVNFQRVAISEKFFLDCHKQRIKDYDFTCVRASANRFLIAAGDALGRIYLYNGDFAENKFNRSKLHWHTMPVNDLCFSSTGNTLFSVGGESGCVVIWDISENNFGKKQIIPRLGMPIRYVNCSSSLNQLVLSFEDNEIQSMDTNSKTKHLKALTRRTINMYKANNYKALRVNGSNLEHKLKDESVGLLWHSITDTLVTNARTGWLQFYSPAEGSRTQALNFLKSIAFSLEKEAKVIPSDITKATLTLDGNWLAFYETRESESSFPDVKLHIWQRSSSSNRWVWIQTADRLHSSTSIVDLKFSPDGQFLVSVSDDGIFHVLHRINLEPKVGTSKTSKEMYAKGFVGNVPEKLPAMATFSQDSSVLAISLKNDTTLIWMIVDPFKLVYECQLCQIDSQSETLPDEIEGASTNSQPWHDVLGLHFGYHKPSQSLAPLCEVRSNSIRIWNILNSEETMEYPEKDAPQDTSENVEFTAAAFDQCPGDGRSLNHFAVSTITNHVLIFKLQILPTTKTLSPLIVVNCTLPYVNPSAPLYYSHMCFLGNPILEIDKNCHGDPQLVKLLNRLCLMNNYQELVSITDKLTLERESACNSCNEIKTFDMSALQAYFAKNVTDYREATKELPVTDKLDSSTITEKQRRIKKRLEVQKMLKDVLIRIPSQNLPNMDTLGPMILDKLI